jgi:FeS assembly protein IscX
MSGSGPLTSPVHELYWDATYAIAVALMEYYPKYNPEEMGLNEIADLVVTLPGFQDDPTMVTEQILLDIQTVWYEEALS